MDALVEKIWITKKNREFMPCRIDLARLEDITALNDKLLHAKLDAFDKVGKQTGKPTPTFKTEAEATEIEFI